MRPYFLALALLTLTAKAQQPTILHAQLTTETATLAQEIQTPHPTPTWLAWSIPTQKPFKSGWQSGNTTYLEGSNETSISDPTTAPSRAILLLRLTAGHVDKLRAESPDHSIDAGNTHVIWLPNVTPDESVAALKSIVLTKEKLDPAIFLISLHDAPSALPALVSLTAPGNDLTVRDKAAFWLANSRGHEGFTAIQKLAGEDKDDRFREKLTFDLTLVKDPAATDELIRIAHEDPAPRVRQQAQFWMSQTAKKRDTAKISAELRHAAESDPDAHTRRQAVFAVSQLPAPEAVNKLTELANTSTHPEVREQAIFWLGQSHDPRALAYLTKLLK